MKKFNIKSKKAGIEISRALALILGVALVVVVAIGLIGIALGGSVKEVVNCMKYVFSGQKEKCAVYPKDSDLTNNNNNANVNNGNDNKNTNTQNPPSETFKPIKLMDKSKTNDIDLPSKCNGYDMVISSVKYEREKVPDTAPAEDKKKYGEYYDDRGYFNVKLAKDNANYYCGLQCTKNLAAFCINSATGGYDGPSVSFTCSDFNPAEKSFKLADCKIS